MIADRIGGEQKQYKGIDIVKFIMALFIVVLHTHPFEGIHGGMNQLTADVLGRIAVPFFFAASGFLLEKKIEKPGADIRKQMTTYMGKLLKLYLLWTAIYLPIIVYSKIICSEEGIKHGIFIALRDFVFCGSYAHLWYLPAVVVGVLLVFSLKKYMGMKKTGILLFALFCMGLLTQSYFGILLEILETDGVIWKLLTLVKKVMVTCRNGVFFAGLFIYIGVIRARLSPCTAMWKSVLGFVISVLALWAEEVLLHKYGMVREEDMYLMQILAAYFLLDIALQLRTNRDTGWLRRMSMNIYFVHMIFKFAYRLLPGRETENGMLLFLVTLVGALLTAFAMDAVTGRRREKEMKFSFF